MVSVRLGMMAVIAATTYNQQAITWEFREWSSKKSPSWWHYYMRIWTFSRHYTDRELVVDDNSYVWDPYQQGYVFRYDDDVERRKNKQGSQNEPQIQWWLRKEEKRW